MRRKEDPARRVLQEQALTVSPRPMINFFNRMTYRLNCHKPSRPAYTGAFLSDFRLKEAEAVGDDGDAAQGHGQSSQNGVHLPQIGR